MKITADRSGWPTREMALLMAEARPALRTGTELIRVLVRGATTMLIPSPNRMIPGKTSMKVSAGGIGPLDQAALVDGIRANQSNPAPAVSGPAVRKRRPPSRPAKLPTRVDRKVRMIPIGRPTEPAANAA